MGQDHDNPTVKSAEEATGMSPLNAQPSSPQPPQQGSYIADPTMDTLPPALTNLPSPLQAFVLGLDTRDSRTKNSETLNPATYPDASKFEDLVRKGLRPEGPSRAQNVALEQVKWPAGFESVRQIVEENGEGIKAFEVVQGVAKADVFVLVVDLQNDRLVGVRFAKQD